MDSCVRATPSASEPPQSNSAGAATATQSGLDPTILKLPYPTRGRPMPDEVMGEAEDPPPELRN